MARDYSNRSNSAGRKNGGKTTANTKRRPAARPSKSKSRQAGSGTPGWIWLVCGLCIGLTVAAAFYVFGRPASVDANESVAIDVPAAAQDGAPEPKAGEAAATEPEQQEPRFAFYEMLPDYEVVIPEEEYPNDTGDTDSAEATAPSEPQPTTPKVRKPGRYVIQAGSFSTYADANRRKAELALLAVEAHIVEFELNSGKTVYRVLSSTIESNSKLNEILKRLRENRIDTLVMQNKS